MKNTIEWIKGFLIAGLTGAIITIILLGSYEIGNAHRIAEKMAILQARNGMAYEPSHVWMFGDSFRLEVDKESVYIDTIENENIKWWTESEK